MGKGRTLITSRSERYLGSLDNNHGQENANGESELGEDEVWSAVDNTENGDDHSANGGWSSRASMESNGSFGIYRSRRASPPPSDHHRQLGGLSLAFDDPSNSSSSPMILHQFRGQDGVSESPRGRHMAASAPVNVPDWSKIHRVDSVESLHELEDGLNDYDPGVVVPPHEYLAREYARSRKNAANSVFEGVGRTLKGRDLSRVRDAVWSQTRFDG
ncbi:protein S40-6-like [Primulina huaijiensis]|uniref:protein S40-6-like n=1 Tax=Primulina huaijiensis TaxID=1492673 RepID=UPI003CC77BA7